MIIPYPIICLVLILCFLIAVFLFVFYYRKYQKSDLERKHSDQVLNSFTQQYKEVHLENMQYQLNPHLLKNVLNSILSHTYQTYYTMDKLAQVLDFVLYESANKLVSPKEEIEFALNLIEINKIKISPLFDVKVKVKVDEQQEPLYKQKILAPLITIDLLENAFKHADLTSPSAFIAIEYSFKNNSIHLNIANKISSKSSLKKEKSGIGQRTLEERLNILYKDKYTLQRYVEDDVFMAYLKIDLYDDHTAMHPTG